MEGTRGAPHPLCKHILWHFPFHTLKHQQQQRQHLERENRVAVCLPERLLGCLPGNINSMC
jgi:hypothetical protein